MPQYFSFDEQLHKNNYTKKKNRKTMKKKYWKSVRAVILWVSVVFRAIGMRVKSSKNLNSYLNETH